MTKAAGQTDSRTALIATLVELEGRRFTDLRTLRGALIEAHWRAERLGDEAAGHRAALLLADMHLREGQLGVAGRAAHQALAWAEQHGDAYLLARAHRMLAHFFRLMGDSSDALSHSVQCVMHLTDDAPRAIRAQHLTSLSAALYDHGAPEQADRNSREALRLATDLGDARLILRILNNMTFAACKRDDEPAARALAERMRDVCARAGLSAGAKERDTLARVDLLGGRYDAVEATLADVIAGLVPDDDGDGIVECLVTLAETRRMAGRYQEAQEALDRAVRECDANGLARQRAQAREEQAALFAAAGRFQEAYEEHRRFYADTAALESEQRQARARAMHTAFETDEARRASEHFRELAHRDALTGLYNRRFVDDHLPALLTEAAARREPASMAIVDLDHFKQINDTLSHATGDAVLQCVGRILDEATPGPALAARLGGEEFLLVFPGVGEAEAAHLCEEVRRRIGEHPWAPVTGTHPVTASIGVTTATDPGETMSDLLARADANLYVAKRSGRDRVEADSRVLCHGAP
jgi:diguanylate cyclase (GGDEF)-like protein